LDRAADGRLAVYGTRARSVRQGPPGQPPDDHPRRGGRAFANADPRPDQGRSPSRS